MTYLGVYGVRGVAGAIGISNEDTIAIKLLLSLI